MQRVNTNNTVKRNNSVMTGCEIKVSTSFQSSNLKRTSKNGIKV
jgi:hypothetical protein